MTKSNEQMVANYRKLLDLLETQRRALVTAGCSDEILDTYSLVLAFLKKLPSSKIVELSGSKRSQSVGRQVRLITDFQATSLSLDEIEKIALDEKTSRKMLEEIAVFRFHVPKGSMRSFQNVEMLREKILVRVQNERTHKSMDEVARQTRR